MLAFWKNFWQKEDGMETLEVLLIIAIIVVIVVLFKDKITEWAEALIKTGDDNINKVTK